MELLKILIIGFIIVFGLSCLGGWLLLASIKITKENEVIVSDPSDEIEHITK